MLRSARNPVVTEAMMKPNVPAAPNRPWAVDDRPGGECAATTA
jgi:hypothetical protein